MDKQDSSNKTILQSNTKIDPVNLRVDILQPVKT